MPDQKIPAKPEKPHEWPETTKIHVSRYHCHFCEKDGEGAHLSAGICVWTRDICRACVRLALWRMAEIPEGQS
jgi:hypothetical protein